MLQVHITIFHYPPPPNLSLAKPSGLDQTLADNFRWL